MKKFPINNIYIIYSLIAPLLYVALFIMNYKYGKICADNCVSRLPISESIFQIMNLSLLCLAILQVVLFICAKHNLLNNLILISNLFHTLCTAMLPVGGLLVLAFGGILFYFPICIVSVILWFKLLFKFLNNQIVKN